MQMRWIAAVNDVDIYHPVCCLAPSPHNGDIPECSWTDIDNEYVGPIQREFESLQFQGYYL